jgi:hypothetical protein
MIRKLMTLVVETAIHEYRAVDLLHELYHKDFYSTFLRARLVWARLETPPELRWKYDPK